MAQINVKSKIFRALSAHFWCPKYSCRFTFISRPQYEKPSYATGANPPSDTLWHRFTKLPKKLCPPPKKNPGTAPVEPNYSLFEIINFVLVLCT